MTIDFIAITIAILLFVRGYKKGMIVALFSIVSIVLGLCCALALSTKLSVFLLDKGYVSSGIAPLISYAILFIGVIWLVRFLAKLLDNLSNTILLGWANKGIGGIVYVAMGMLVYSTVLWMCNSAHLISPETIVHAKTYRYIEPIAPWVFEHIGQFIPFAKNIFGDLRHFFDSINQQLPEHVGAH